MSEFLSLVDICQRYGISKWTVYAWTAKNLIPHLKIGGKILFRQKDLERWEESNLSGVIKANLV